jgi:CRP/FNR family transcriptional regulator
MNPAPHNAIADKVAAFFADYPLRTFEKRQILVRPQEPLGGVYYLAEGRVNEYDITPDGKEVVVNIFKPGAFFPMSSALNATPNDYFFEASTTVAVRIAPPEAAVQFLRDNPDVALDLLKRVYNGVDGVLRRMAHLMGGNAQHRLLFEVLNAVHRFGEQQGDGSWLLPLNESDLGKHSGLARETVNRNIKSLKDAGLLKVGAKTMVIVDLKKLEALLGNTV